MTRHTLFILSSWVFVLSHSTSALAQETGGEAKKWAEDYFSGSKIEKGAFPQKIFLSIFKGTAATAFDVDIQEAEKQSYLRFPPPRDTSFAMLLNRQYFPYLSPSDVAADLFGADSFLKLKDGSAEAQFIYGPTGEKLAGKIQPAAIKAGRVDVILKDLFVSLGYDGVVLDYREGKVLVGSFASKLTRHGQQALIVKDSSDRINLEDQEFEEGAALIALRDFYQGFGVFDVIVGSGDSEFRRGTKVVIERTGKRKKIPAKNKQP